MQTSDWCAPSTCRSSVSVNLSARQFHAAQPVAEIQAASRRRELDPAQLCLEITESAAMQTSIGPRGR